MFKPGHLHREHLPDKSDPQTFVYDVHYEVRDLPEKGQVLHMRMDGAVDGKAFSEECELPRDMAFDFMNELTRVAVRNGLHPRFGPILREHDEYDAMFEDIRHKLGLRPGEPIDLGHLPGR
ncbi:DUF5064 family protein [Azotobacter salinestris]|uniref:DUF5064 family protein n=1 Tax=Azotobacter salinestris TaxID=69964 RepID=UPI0012669F42|nr:DUF5064 family protein [Azotobacter salinestris]